MGTSRGGSVAVTKTDRLALLERRVQALEEPIRAFQERLAALEAQFSAVQAAVQALLLTRGRPGRSRRRAK